ncbi:Fur family transcriptional regulator [Desulfonatronum thiodismutans]|uniref:Fur family transcriptional regulator n=1 Tax=Desulfonatronum thiodismutans TaxID=159290 RepID=UPI00068CAB79|nr:transcriptional repressor [Desulfonatronum thiodismutans]
MTNHHHATDSKARQEQMTARLKERDFRLTPQRLAVLRILASSDGHPSVERIYEQVRRDFPTTSIATVYKTVALLRELGEVLELGFPDGSNRYDGSKPYPHPHVICTKCKTILDPELNGLTDLTKEVSQETGFRVTTHRVDFFGVCRACQEAGAGKETEGIGS